MEGVEDGLPRELGMLMAAVMRAKLGAGEGMRGREWCSWKRDIVVVVVVVVVNGETERKAGSK
jgi:hypothetical protein